MNNSTQNAEKFVKAGAGKSESGFSLIKAVIAILVLTIGLVGMFN